MKFEVLHRGQVIDTKDLGEGSHKIGRAKDCEIALNSPQISKQHAMIVIKGGKAAVLDMGSVNGVFVNGVLIRKQRINRGDEIVMGEFRIRFAGTGAPASQGMMPRTGMSDASAPMNEMGFDGNLALSPNPMMAASPLAQPLSTPEPEAQMSPQEKLLLLMDEKVFGFFFNLNKTVDWRLMIGGIVAVGMALTVGASVFALLDWGLKMGEGEALARGHAVVSQCVRENYRVLAQSGDYSRMSVAAIQKERGILKAVIVDPDTQTALAPVELGRAPVRNPFELLAMNEIVVNGKELYSQPMEDGRWVLVQPLFIYPKEGERQLKGVVMVHFQIPDSLTQTYEPIVTAILIATLLGMICFLLLQKIISHPIAVLHDQLDATLKGDADTVACDVKFPELETLSQQINFAVSRFRQAETSKSQDISIDDFEADNLKFVDAVKSFDVGLSDGFMLLDSDKKVRFIGHVLEEMLSMKNDYAYGQNISECCRDATLAGTIIDLCENVLRSFGETQYAQLAINGVNREVTGVAHKDGAGSVNYILVIVKIMSLDT